MAQFFFKNVLKKIYSGITVVWPTLKHAISPWKISFWFFFMMAPLSYANLFCNIYRQVFTESYLAEQFPKITPYLAEQFHQITCYLTEQFHQIAQYLAEHLILTNHNLYH